MNITFLIGNGFDLNLGLKTAYTHFLEHYLKDDKNDNDIIKRFKSIIKEEQTKNIDTWADVEISLGRITNEFKHISEFVDCIENFCEKLSKYLENEQDKINYEKNKEAIISNFKGIFYHLKNKIDDNCKSILPSYLSNFYFINFNYTNTLDNCLKIFNNEKTCIKIHNSLGNHTILGVGDESQIENAEFKKDITFLEVFIKEKCSYFLGNVKYENILPIIKNSDIIIIYGMSLGKTDNYWWEKICYWLNETSHNKLIIYNFGIESKTFKFHYHTKGNETKDKFLKFCPNVINQTRIRNQIYCIESNIFEEIKDISE